MAEFKCNKCRARLHAPPEISGSDMQCPYCDAVVRVPEDHNTRQRQSSGSRKIQCLKCGKGLRIPDGFKGDRAKCKCGAILKIPEIEKEESATSFDMGILQAALDLESSANKSHGLRHLDVSPLASDPQIPNATAAPARSQRCVRCGQSFQVPPSLAGSQISCPSCGQINRAIVSPMASGANPVRSARETQRNSFALDTSLGSNLRSLVLLLLLIGGGVWFVIALQEGRSNIKGATKSATTERESDADARRRKEKERQEAVERRIAQFDRRRTNPAATASGRSDEPTAKRVEQARKSEEKRRQEEAERRKIAQAKAAEERRLAQAKAEAERRRLAEASAEAERLRIAEAKAEAERQLAETLSPSNLTAMKSKIVRDLDQGISDLSKELRIRRAKKQSTTNFVRNIRSMREKRERFAQMPLAEFREFTVNKINQYAAEERAAEERRRQETARVEKFVSLGFSDPEKAAMEVASAMVDSGTLQSARFQGLIEPWSGRPLSRASGNEVSSSFSVTYPNAAGGVAAGHMAIGMKAHYIHNIADPRYKIWIPYRIVVNNQAVNVKPFLP